MALNHQASALARGRSPFARGLAASLLLCLAFPTPLLAGAPPQAGDVLDLPAEFQPTWASVEPQRQLHLTYNPALSATDNGEVFKDTLQALQAGDELVISAGTWSVNSFFDVSVSGTSQAPIRVVAAPGARPVLTRPNASQNVINLGSPAFGGIRYFLLRGLEITGGFSGIRIYDGMHVWIDDCEIHHVPGVGLSTNTHDTSHIFVTRNEIHHTGLSGQTGEGMYLGGNFGSVKMSHSVIARNHVHHTGGSQGDGIELKQGSYDNWIVENRVHDTIFPCILAYGTYGEARNRIERNTLMRATFAVLQVQGEALVSDNLIFGGPTGFNSHDHQDGTRELVFVNNTVVTNGDAARLSDWHNRPGMVLANNALYSGEGEALRFAGGCNGIVVEGNITFGPVVGCSTGWSQGTGLDDFENASFDGSLENAVPAPGSPLRSVAYLPLASGVDGTGMVRGDFPSVGAAEPGVYGEVLGSGLAGFGGLIPRLSASALPSAGNTNLIVRLEQARPNAPAFLLTGMAVQSIPFRDGLLYPVITGVERVTTTGQGRAIAELSLAGGSVFAGQSLIAQWAVFDADAPQFYALSPGVRWILE